MIAIIDYGLGNVRAFANVYKKLNIPAVIAAHAEDLKGATKIILPGVGSFDHAMQRFGNSGMRPVLEKMIFGDNISVMGICVGMQMLADSSEEGNLPGLGWIRGKVKKIVPSVEYSVNIPHMGWNDVKPIKKGGLMNELESDARFYFLHSYYFENRNNEDLLAVTAYAGEFACAVNSGNVYGVQFHPEKSHNWGIQLLKNFAEL
ncbi:MAG: imidazole glycerol phosphate synthase subunit HisH [Solirubrobacterales bacterium]